MLIPALLQNTAFQVLSSIFQPSSFTWKPSEAVSKPLGKRCFLSLCSFHLKPRNPHLIIQMQGSDIPLLFLNTLCIKNGSPPRSFCSQIPVSSKTRQWNTCALQAFGLASKNLWLLRCLPYSFWLRYLLSCESDGVGSSQEGQWGQKVFPSSPGYSAHKDSDTLWWFRSPLYRCVRVRTQHLSGRK